MHAQIVASGRTVYETPPEVFRPLDREFHFTLDVCATPQNAKCERYFTEAEDGLKQSWAGERCWMNPPYGSGIVRWVAKAARADTLVVGLVPASTDTNWWHDWIEGQAEVRFIRQRVRFVGMTGRAPHPHAIVIWRPKS
jgi:site-specific DNA-methyltransferase (adenine-specific)